MLQIFQIYFQKQIRNLILSQVIRFLILIQIIRGLLLEYMLKFEQNIYKCLTINKRVQIFHWQLWKPVAPCGLMLLKFYSDFIIKCTEFFWIHSNRLKTSMDTTVHYCCLKFLAEINGLHSRNQVINPTLEKFHIWNTGMDAPAWSAVFLLGGAQHFGQRSATGCSKLWVS